MIVMEKERINKAATAIDAYKERNTWPKLDPLPEAAETTPDAYPMHALGKVLGEAARAIADDVQAPDALVAGSVLAAASLAAQPLANVVLPHGQRCPLSLFIVSSGQSGDRKSAADAVAGSEIEEARRRDAREYAKELQRYEDAKASKGIRCHEPRPSCAGVQAGIRHGAAVARAVGAGADHPIGKAPDRPAAQYRIQGTGR